MELCSLDDAFSLPSAQPSAGCLGNKSTVNAKREERKKARRCRGPALTYIESDMSMSGPAGYSAPFDPDRPAVQRMSPIPALNKATGLRQHQPVTQDWGTMEPFQNGQQPDPSINAGAATFVSESEDDLKQILKVSQGPNKLQSGSVPSYFGANLGETAGSPLPGKTTEGFSGAPYVDIIGSAPSDAFLMKGGFVEDSAKWLQEKKKYGQNPQQRSSRGTGFSLLSPPLTGLESPKLPPPETDIAWHQGTIPGGQSAFFENWGSMQKKKFDDANNRQTADEMSNNEVLQKMDHILARLDDMQYVNQDLAQREVLLFVMSGLGVVFLMDLACRTAGSIL